MKIKSYWFDDINEAECTWMALMSEGYKKKERLKIKFNWRTFRTMYRFKVIAP